MRAAGMPIESLLKYMNLMKQGKKTVRERKELLVEQKNVLIEKQKEINCTIDRLNYKIELYNEIEEGIIKDFTE